MISHNLDFNALAVALMGPSSGRVKSFDTFCVAAMPSQLIKVRAICCQGELNPITNLSGSESTTKAPPHNVTA